MVLLTPELAERLASPVTSLVLCWRIVRMDGVAMGFTSHDRDLVVDGMTYRAAPGLLPSAVALSDGLEADTMEMSGVLSAAGLTEAELAAGRYDGARLWLFLADWERPEAGALPLARGTLGTVTRSDQAFTVELRGPAEVLERPVLELTSPECRAMLGDRRCRVDLKPLSRETGIVALTDDTVTVVDAAPGDDLYGYGRLRVLDGAAAGLEAAIASSAGPVMTLRQPLAVRPAIGDRVMIREGCDKRFATCRARFGNGDNFRGEPHLPGADLLTRYGGF